MKFAIGPWARKKKRRREELLNQQRHLPQTREGERSRVAVAETELRATTPPREPDDALCLGVIESKEGADDGVSLMTDPYFGDTMNALMDFDNTVGESVVSSQQGLYVYGMRRPRADTGADSTQAGGSTADGSHRPLFGDDATLEGLYHASPAAPPRADDAADARRFRVVAPPGRLGIVVDNPRGALPVVHAIKETSPLHGRLRVGDRLLAVDEVDCAGMSAQRASALLSDRSRNPARTLLLARAARG